MNLHNLPPGSSAYISRLNAHDSIRRRLLDMGFTQGTKVACLYASPAGDPKAYAVFGTVIALRSEEASQIEIFRPHTEEGCLWD